jgi:quercetin dioxygenase-like cupin family protein
MLVFSLQKEQEWGVQRHIEKVLGKVGGGDVTVACWEPGQTSVYHCHPEAHEIYFCFEGGGKMRTPERTVDIVPGGFVVHPAGELHEYINGAQRTLLFRVRYGGPTYSRGVSWPSHPEWKQSAADLEFFANNPEKLKAEVR